MNLPDENENPSTQYISALYYLGTHEMLNTAPAVALLQHVANESNSTILAGIMGGVALVAGQVHRDVEGRDEDTDLFVQEEWPDWTDSADHPLYLRSLQFINASLNCDSQAALMVWTSVITDDSTPEQDTAFLFYLLDDMQEVIARILGLDDEEDD